MAVPAVIGAGAALGVMGATVGFGGDTGIIGYDAWVRVEGCSGHVLVRFDRWGDYRTTGDLTACG